MRVLPTGEQMAYLISIGVADAIKPPPPSPVICEAIEFTTLAPVNTRKSKIRWWAILFFLVVLLLSVSMVRAEPKGEPEQSRLVNSGEKEPPKIGRAVEKVTAQRSLPATGSNKSQGMVSKLSKEKIRLAEGEHRKRIILLGEIPALRRDLSLQQDHFNRALSYLGLLAVLGIILLLIGRVLMEKRIHHIEGIVLSHLSKDSNDGSSIPVYINGENKDEPEKERSVRIEPARPLPQKLPPPVRQIEMLIKSASLDHNIRVKPTLPLEMWEIGLATNKGNVRSENQDYCLSFRTAGHDVMILADGCGGVPYGQRASFLAAVDAAVFVIRAYGVAPPWYTPPVKDIAAKAIDSAAHRLANEGDKLNITDVRGGLRTTLIVVIGNRREIGYAYIGDGGGCVVKSSGEVHRFLNPQKASEFAMNVLAPEDRRIQTR